jgi:hypothetical protein
MNIFPRYICYNTAICQQTLIRIVLNVFNYLRYVHLRPDDDPVVVETRSIAIFVINKYTVH